MGSPRISTKVGTVIIFRQDGKDLSKNEPHCIYDFLYDLINLTISDTEKYDTWSDMVFTNKLNFKESWNKKQIEFVSV